VKGLIKEWPCYDGWPVSVHPETVAQHDSSPAQVCHFVFVVPVKPLWAGKTEPYRAAGNVLFNIIPDGSVPTGRSFFQGPVKKHGWPRAFRPQGVLFRRQGIDERTGLFRSTGKLPVMNVDDLHGLQVKGESKKEKGKYQYYVYSLSLYGNNLRHQGY
jgi:hypothetical protein